MSRRFVALVSDMDGTLVNSEPEHARAYQRVLHRRFGVRVKLAEFHQFTGVTDAVIAVYLVEKYKLAITPLELVVEKEAALAQLLFNAQPLPGVVDTLKTARALRLKRGVASSATLGGIENILRTVKLRRYFQAIASGEEVANSKPAPDVFLLAAQRLGVEPEDCIALEDSGKGSQAARQAGMFCVAIPCGTEREDLSAAHLKLRSMTELDLRKLVARL